MASIRLMLESRGWKCVEARRQGCFKHVLWLDPKTNWVMTQAEAVRHVRYRNSVAREAKKLTLLRVTLDTKAKQWAGDPEGPAA